MAWLALAAFGIGYIGIASTRPDLLAGVLPLSDPNADQAYTTRSAADLADELITLRKWVNDLQHEMAATRSAVQSQGEQGKVMQQRLTVAEERLPATREARAEPPPKAVPQPRVALAAPAALRPAATATAQDTAEPTAAKVAVHANIPANVKVINQSAASEITTGSVPGNVSPPATPAFGPAKVTAPAVRGIEIADAESLEGLRTRWQSLSSQHAGALKQLEPRYRISANGSSNPFTLLAGPFASTAEATRACAQLRAGGVACKVSDYGGNGL